MTRYTLVVGTQTKTGPPPFTVDFIALNNIEALETIHRFVFDTKEWRLMNTEFGELVAPHTGVKHDGSCQRCGCKSTHHTDVRYIDYARMDGYYCKSCRKYMRNTYTLLQDARKRYKPSKRKDMVAVAEAKEQREAQVAARGDVVHGRRNKPLPKSNQHAREMLAGQNKKAVQQFLQQSAKPEIPNAS